MKILYLTSGDHVDYQNDCLLIGLKELYGSDVVDYYKHNHSYTSFDVNRASGLYGKGMTISRVLPDLEVDRTNIGQKVRNKFFDLIVYGSIRRFHNDIEKVLKFYPKKRVICVDGEDETYLDACYSLGTPYFKREYDEPRANVLPISFAFPTSKVNFNKNKIKDYSFITPLDKTTYVYTEEKEYYRDYEQARLGITTKKSGWDCLRHYEIMGNGAIPHFINLESCPHLTMNSFPKEICLSVKKDLEQRKETPQTIYEKYIDQLENHFLKNNTTEALAKYFIKTIYAH